MKTTSSEALKSSMLSGRIVVTAGFDMRETKFSMLHGFTLALLSYSALFECGLNLTQTPAESPSTL